MAAWWRRLTERWLRFSAVQRLVMVVGGAVLVAGIVATVAARLSAPPPSLSLARRILGKAPYRPVILGFYENDSSPGAGDGSYASFQANARYIDVVSPYWYRIGNGGLFTMDSYDPRVTAFAARHSVTVWPLVGNDGYGMLTTPSARRTTVTALVDLAVRRHYGGVFIDFELIPPTVRDAFSTFMHDLSLALHRRNLGLGVAVFPKVGVSPDVQGVYDYPALGGLADAVVVMAYDHHSNSSPPGAVAPLPWVRANMLYAMRLINPPKLLVGVGAYGYDWTAPGAASTVSTRQVASILTRLGITPLWSRLEQEPHFAFTAGGNTHTVWYEDTFTFRQKLALARSLRLGGFAIWRLGYEEPSFWTALAHEERGLPPKPLPPVTHPKAT